MQLIADVSRLRHADSISISAVQIVIEDPAAPVMVIYSLLRLLCDVYSIIETQNTYLAYILQNTYLPYRIRTTTVQNMYSIYKYRTEYVCTGMNCAAAVRDRPVT